MTTVLVVIVAALAIAAVGFAVGMLLAPAIGRWARRITEGDDDE
jgi:gas vesicle protein